MPVKERLLTPELLRAVLLPAVLLRPASAPPVLLRLIDVPLKLLPVARCRALLLLQFDLLLPVDLLLPSPFPSKFLEFTLDFCKALPLQLQFELQLPNVDLCQRHRDGRAALTACRR